MAFIGSLLTASKLEEVAAILDHPEAPQINEFYDLRHREIILAVQDLRIRGLKPDIITVHQSLRDRGKLEAVGGLEYINKLCDLGSSSLDNAVCYYGEMVREKARLRGFIQVGQRLQKDAMAGLESSVIATATSKEIAELCHVKHTRQVKTMKELVNAALLSMEARWNGETVGIHTGLPDIDKYIGSGWQAGQMVCIAGRPSTGKTSFGMNVAERVADKHLEEWKVANGIKPYEGPKVLVFSLETTGEKLVDRMIQCRSQVSTFNIKELDQREFARLAQASGDIAQLPIVVNDESGLRVSEIMTVARWHKANGGLSMIVVDYLQLVQPDNPGRTSNREHEVASVSVGMKALAKEMDVPVVCLTQLNRDCERLGGHPKMSWIRDSGHIEQDADFIAVLWEGPRSDDDEDEIPSGSAKPTQPVVFTIVKQKEGPNNFDVNLVFRKNIFRFESAAKINERDIPQ